MNKIKSLFKTISQIFKVLLSVIVFIIKSLLYLFDKAINEITKRLRFSIRFKITATYVSIFILIFSLISLGIIFSFEYYIQNNSPQDYIYILGTILGVFNILGIISIILISSRTSKKLLSPIYYMTKTVKEISINDLHKRLDISGSKDELKDLAKTFNDMLDRIQNSVELQNQFVSDASHELRTPISVIQGYANLLDRWGKDDRQVLEESILAIKSESENMKILIENLLFLARGDKNNQKTYKENFSINEIISEVLKETKLIDSNHNILNEKNEEFIINGDKNLIKEAVRIFVDNSIKYTPNGGNIKLNSYKNNNNAIIIIEDTGIGISKDDIKYIFNRFYRVDKARTKKDGGTGLGLSIAKWIIDNHNGTIDVSSTLKVGTTIKIKLPINI